MATGMASGGRRLPRGSAVFTTFPDLLFVFEFDTAYHCLAALFYFSVSALETLVTIDLQDDLYKHYSENISAVVFSIIVTLLYVVHAVFSLIRCKVSYRNREHS
ncbi:myelin and lymphocyte protein-like isoform X3 [Muntiacus reevesi]|uniref:myelin and lymphocyte protein-like isoform X3 n=1 Tax=Muntiacus reevesi TaxID=9886 RepID=UPI003307A5AD